MSDVKQWPGWEKLAEEVPETCHADGCQEQGTVWYVHRGNRMVWYCADHYATLLQRYEQQTQNKVGKP